MQLLKESLIKNSSRRRFLTLISVGILSFISTRFFAVHPKKISDQEELILVNGWVLKKKDLNVI